MSDLRLFFLTAFLAGLVSYPVIFFAGVIYSPFLS